jgi:predicted nucleotidyltransferase
MPESGPEFALRRLEELGERLRPVKPHLAGKPLCVYATGSYGRLEAWEGSDVDLFFLYDGSGGPGDRFPYTDFVRLAAALVDAADAMGFPPFSGDGRYLDVHYVDEMERVLGSPRDDSNNAFTARLLLLLESRPVHDAELYEQLLERVVGFYYRDFEDHPQEFLPVFLTNDILRFWRTLTLNYEHHRLKLLDLVGEELELKKVESALKNYKLKVSRLATCFSMVAALSAAEVPVLPRRVVDLCRMTPADRLAELRQHSGEAASVVDELSAIYSEFLESTQRDEQAVVDDFRDAAYRQEAVARAAAYGDRTFQLLQVVTPPDRFRYLVV